MDPDFKRLEPIYALMRNIDDGPGGNAGYRWQLTEDYLNTGDYYLVRQIDGRRVRFTIGGLVTLSPEDFFQRIGKPLVLLPRADRAESRPEPVLPRPEETRGSTHGDYTRTATTAQNIKIAMRAGPEGRAAWGRLRPVQTESLELIATKVARIMVGDSFCEDHWRDIAGYATLVADRIKSGELKNVDQADGTAE